MSTVLKSLGINQSFSMVKDAMAVSIGMTKFLMSEKKKSSIDKALVNFFVVTDNPNYFTKARFALKGYL